MITITWHHKCNQFVVEHSMRTWVSLHQTSLVNKKIKIKIIKWNNQMQKSILMPVKRLSFKFRRRSRRSILIRNLNWLSVLLSVERNLKIKTHRLRKWYSRPDVHSSNMSKYNNLMHKMLFLQSKKLIWIEKISIKCGSSVKILRKF